jgi:hypothetical protein
MHMHCKLLRFSMLSVHAVIVQHGRSVCHSLSNMVYSGVQQCTSPVYMNDCRAATFTNDVLSVNLVFYETYIMDALTVASNRHMFILGNSA